MRTITLTEREASVLRLLLRRITGEDSWLSVSELQMFYISEVKHKLERAKKEEFHA